MKWGVRKQYEPHPRKTSKSKTKSDDDLNRKRGLTDKQKKAIAVGVSAVAAGLAVYGAYKLKKSGKLDYLVNKGKSAFGEIRDPVTYLNLKSEKTSRLQDLKACNPNFNKKPGTTLNCTHCGIAFELRRRGFDVEAAESFTTRPFSDIGKYFKGFIQEHVVTAQKSGETVSEFRKRAYDNVSNDLKSYGDGARGIIGGYSKRVGNHVFSWEVSNGVVRFSDPQRGVADASTYLTRLFDADRYEYARLDDLSINAETIKQVVRNRAK